LRHARRRGWKVFFFEKKKQKTFAPALLDLARNLGEKLFWFFLKKSTPLLPFAGVAPAVRIH
jgi:hypothetical protein